MTGPASAGEISAPALEHVAIWREVYDTLYLDGEPWGRLGDDFRGWDSAYDGSPIPEADMRSWRDTTVARILELFPRRVVEIGVGGGLLLALVAPHVQHYTGTDFSPSAIEILKRRLNADRPELTDRVHLEVTAAHERARLLRAGPADLVVLNSVAQYFPDLDYLTAVVATAAELAGPTGAVLVGDVRCEPLREHFATDVARARGADANDLGPAAARVLATDRELFVAPDWFAATARRLGLHCQIRCKQGPDNELTRYRYDVVLVGPQRPVVDAGAAPTVPWLDAQDGLDLRAPVRIVGIPNRRLTRRGPDPDRPLTVAPGVRSVVRWSRNDPATLDLVLVPASAGPGVVITER
ncbi:methyltransferase family protein [Amycolatopsis sulphurea]|uniref:Methyltransferase family protein n=1 Tax=Amycolatopsis sulphurea TaxID=76022 RepID=A0A2A9FE25_9PSEU|nr:class I SAM-dependent methyltransferase [Amycolatopsis sulphurea]PFG49408.1 methyltransferase family protein [Amycolatopsis sulphurea]